MKTDMKMWAATVDLRKADHWETTTDKPFMGVTWQEAMDNARGFIMASGFGHYDFRITCYKVDVEVDVPNVKEEKK